jgi:cysteine desulfurase/selenocysteine lyase
MESDKTLTLLHPTIGGSSGRLTLADVHDLRRTEFPWTDQTIYMDNAATGPLPERTVAVLRDLTARRADLARMRELNLFELLDQTRSAVARLVNGDADEISLAVNTSYGVNIAAQVLPLGPGDCVLLPDGEFPANVYPWLLLKKRGINVELAESTPEGWPDEDYLVRRIQDPDVRVLAISLVQFANGFKADMARLSEACRASNCYLVVDGIQGVGQVPFNVKVTPVDIVACGAQKWLLSPWGSGFVYVRRELLREIEPPVVGWMAYRGTDDHTRITHYDENLWDDGRRLELNTLPFQDLIAMKESINLLLDIGVERVSDWLREVREPVITAAAAGRMGLMSPTDGQHESGIVSVTTSNTETSYDRLRNCGVICSYREGGIRLAPHCFSTPEEMESVVETITRGQ